MIINIYGVKDGWYLQSVVDAIMKYSDKSIEKRFIHYKDPIVYPDGINFFCNMGIYEIYLRNKVPPAIRDVILTTHIERWRPWNIRSKRLYYLPVTLIAFCRRWYDFFVRHGIHPVDIAIPGVDEEFFNIEPDKTKKDKKTIALISRLQLSGRKGGEWFKPLLKKIGKDFKWLIIGDLWESLLENQFFKNYDITYIKTPPKQEYYNLFRTFDIFLSLSKIEGGPMPLIESMAAGVVPVVSDTGFANEVIKEGESGFVYPVGNLRKLVKILEFLKDKDINGYKQKAKQDAKPYTWKNFVLTIIAVISDVNKKLGQK